MDTSFLYTLSYSNNNLSITVASIGVTFFTEVGYRVNPDVYYLVELIIFAFRLLPLIVWLYALINSIKVLENINRGDPF